MRRLKHKFPDVIKKNWVSSGCGHVCVCQKAQDDTCVLRFQRKGIHHLVWGFDCWMNLEKETRNAPQLAISGKSAGVSCELSIMVCFFLNMFAQEDFR